MAPLLLLVGCDQSDPLPPTTAEPLLDPADFFTGKSKGDATLDIIFSDPKPVRVASVGRRRSDGSLLLVQAIREGDKPARVRRWTIRQAGPGRWIGSLTDAVGPVQIAAKGNSATIDYAAKDGVHIHQELRLQPDRRTMLNRLTATKWGIEVGTLNETIRKRD